MIIINIQIIYFDNFKIIKYIKYNYFKKIKKYKIKIFI